MNWEQVKDAGDFSFFERIIPILKYMIGTNFITFLISFLIFVMITCMVILVLLMFIKENYIIPLSLGLSFLIFIVLSAYIGLIKETDLYKDWEKKSVTPYFQTLEKETKKLKQIQILSEKEELEKAGIEKNMIFFPKLEKSEGEELLPVSMIYENENGAGKVYKGYAYVKFDKNIREAKVTFTKLEHDLGHGYEKGYYHPIISIPDKFKFSNRT